MGEDQKVRLSVEIPKSLWRAAKQKALDTDRDLRDVVIEALGRHLNSDDRNANHPRTRAKKGGRQS